MKDNYYILTGAMGRGKSTVINKLKDKTLTCIKEPARKILAEQRLIDGLGVPEKDPSLFCQLVLSRSIYQYQLMEKGFGEMLKNLFQSLNYQIIEVPKYSPINRARFIMEHINSV